MPASKQPAPKKSFTLARHKERTVRLVLLLTPSEQQQLKESAVAAGLKVSEFVRRCIARRTLPRQIPQVNWLTYLELGTVCVNLNQLTSAATTAVKNGQPIPPIELEMLSSLSALVKEIQKQTLGTTTSDEVEV